MILNLINANLGIAMGQVDTMIQDMVGQEDLPLAFSLPVLKLNIAPGLWRLGLCVFSEGAVCQKEMVF